MALISPAQPCYAGTCLLPSTVAGENEPEAYPLGYLEDSIEPRTQLETIFNSR